MKAIVQDTYGNPDVLRLRDIAVPQAGRGEVLVRVRAAGLGRLVFVRQMTGGILQGWPPATPYPRISRVHRTS